MLLVEPAPDMATEEAWAGVEKMGRLLRSHGWTFRFRVRFARTQEQVVLHASHLHVGTIKVRAETPALAFQQVIEKARERLARKSAD